MRKKAARASPTSAGFGGLPIGKELGIELSSPLIGPLTVKPSSCG